MSTLAEHRFEWTRYWRVLSSPSDRLGEEEYGEDDFLHVSTDWPAEIAGKGDSPLRTFPELLHSPALVLLGRPGAGKSTELEMARDAGLLENEGVKLVYHRAKDFEGNVSELLAEVDQERTAGRSVRLVLDGADELLLENAKFLNVLETELSRRIAQSIPLPQLIISCRAAEWPEGKLTNVWPHGQLIVARLCQLDYAAANALVKHCLGVDAEKFWQTVAKMKVGFLAIWPYGLIELIQNFQEQGGTLSTSLLELVRRAAMRRCDVHHSESDPERRQRQRNHDVPTNWMFRLAGRAAALSCFSAKQALARNPADADGQFITVNEFLAEPEPWSDPSIRPITQRDLDALERPAIFDSIGKQRVVFAHQLFREFMASSWLTDRKLTVPQLEALFGCRREDGSWRHYPQLAAIAAWLATHSKQQKWRTFLMAHDPAVLLRADAANLPTSEKLDIARALLERAVRDQAVDTGWQHRQLRSLACEGLGDVLRPYLLNFRGDHEAARDLAIDIAREAQVKDVAADLWKAVRHPHVKLRPYMAKALMEVAKDGYELEWMEVLDENIPLDDEGALLGAALKVMVPDKLKVRNVLRHLIPKRDFGIIGLYDMVHRDMVKIMEKPDALPIVQHSAKHHASGFDDWSEDNKESLLSKALLWLGEDLDSPDVMSAFVEWWWAAILGSRRKPEMDRGSPTLRELGFENIERRRAVIECAVSHPRFKNIKADDYFWYEFEEFVNLSEDIDWLVSKLTSAEPRAERIYAGYLRRAYGSTPKNTDFKSNLLAAYERSAELQTLLPKPVDGRTIFEELDALHEGYMAERAKAQAETEEQQRKWDLEHQVKIERCFKRALDLCTSKDWHSWEWLATALSHEDRRSGGMISLGDIEKIHTRGESWMFDSARLWLKHSAPPYPVTDDKEAISLGIHATWALYALWNQLDADTDVIVGISNGWLPHILSNMLRCSWEKDDFTIEKCLLRFRPESLGAVMSVLRHDYRTKSEMWSVRYLEPVAHEASKELKRLLMDVPPQPQGFQMALGWLASRDLAAAANVAAHWLDEVPSGRSEQGDIALFAGIVIHLQGRLWKDVKERVWNQPETAAKTLRAGFHWLGFHMDTRLDLKPWPAAYLVDIAELMMTAFPPESDPPSRGGMVTPRQEMMDARAHLLNEIESRGMTAAISRLEALRVGGTGRWLKQMHLRASNADQAARWQPVSPLDLLAIADDHDLSLVRSDDDLMRAVQVALEEYEIDLRTTSHGEDIRNEGALKHEERLSDHLAQWLREHLKLHRIRESQTVEGTKEDITIVLNLPGTDPLNLCIEVKKDDSADLLQRMRTQLLDLYLRAQKHRTHGIYVVFWAVDGDSPSHPGIETAEELAAFLDKQAEELSLPPYCLAAKVINCREKTKRRRKPKRHGRGSGKAKA